MLSSSAPAPAKLPYTYAGGWEFLTLEERAERAKRSMMAATDELFDVVAYLIVLKKALFVAFLVPGYY